MKKLIQTTLLIGLSSLFFFCGCELLSTDEDDVFGDYPYEDYGYHDFGIISGEFDVSVTGIELGDLIRFDSLVQTSVSIQVLDAHARSSVSSGTKSPSWNETLLRATPEIFATTWHVAIHDDAKGTIVDECDVEVTKEMVRTWRGFEVDVCGSSTNLAVQFSPVDQLSL